MAAAWQRYIPSMIPLPIFSLYIISLQALFRYHPQHILIWLRDVTQSITTADISFFTTFLRFDEICHILDKTNLVPVSCNCKYGWPAADLWN